MKLSDYIFCQLREWGSRHVFLITGGGAMHLNDSIGTSGLGYICTHHEQAAAMAAEGYARITGKPGVLNVTSGPGGINALNGVFGAWTDSIPMLILSGQVKRETCMATYGLTDLRQLGDQEVDIVRMVKGITKYSVFLSEPESVAYHLERAWHLAQTGRSGPCWLDIPVDVQSAQIEPAQLRHYDPAEDILKFDREMIADQVANVLEHITKAERPVIFAGSGVRLGGALIEFEQVIRALRIPVVTAWTHDLIASNDELFCGRPGTIGERAGNFTVQNSDLLLVLGSRLNIRQTSYNWNSFARFAIKIQVDVDPAELRKPLHQPDIPICCDVKLFLAEMVRQLEGGNHSNSRHEKWLDHARCWKEKYPVVQPRQRVAGPPLNPYDFIDRLFEMLGPQDAVVCGNATACIVPYQAGKLKKGERLISNSGSGQMLPLPMNEYLQENLKQTCGVNVEFDVVEWQVLLTAVRQTPDSPALHGAMALNISSPSSDVGIMARYFSSANFAPNGFNFEHWKDDKFDAALATLAESTDEKTIEEAFRAAHERLVDNPPWLYMVHDLNPRAMTKNVQGFVSPQSWFADLTMVSIR